MMTEITVANPDAIVVGSGLAGLTVALHILDRGGSVVILEKEPKMGGNSVKASSGINHALGADQVSKFQQDTLQSAGASAQPELIDILVNKSNDAIQWFQTRIGVDLEEVGQLGGHSTPRTRRPKGGAVGWEIMSRLQKTIQEFPPEKVQLVVNTKVTQLLQDDYGKVIGVQYEESSKTAGNGDIISSQGGEIRAPHVVLCTGGFAADRSSGSLLAQYQPQFLKMGATAGEFSTGDGIKLATPVGAGLVDIEKVQVHPTGFVDLKDPSNPQNILAAELIRGIGGILVDQSGKRFCNELGTRSYVTDRMFAHCSLDYANSNSNSQHRVWDINTAIPTFYLVLSEAAAASGGKHTGFYEFKGLLQKVQGLEGLAKWIVRDGGADGDHDDGGHDAASSTTATTLEATLTDHETAASSSKGEDEFGKTVFNNVPTSKDGIYYVGKVTPVLHYCMGGLKIDTQGRVLLKNEQQQGQQQQQVIIPGLFACGEVAGGVHGDNRLGGNSLLECTVFGTIVGEAIPLAKL